MDIYGTGSNAKLLSGELATYLSGRYIEIKVYGLTYGEFLKFHGQEQGIGSLESYLKFGGLPIGEKYYFEDLGIRNALVGFRAVDINKVMENVIFTHLKVAGYDVTVGRIGKREVDFVCEKAGERIYIQAAYMISDDKVRDREFGNLLAIPDNFPKKVISMDEVAGSSYEGIEHVHLKDFLLSV